MMAAEISRLWPFCFHVTFAANLPSISKMHAILPAAELLRSAGLRPAPGPRQIERKLQVDGFDVYLRNQRALDSAELGLSKDESLGDFLAFLDQRTYFWPGHSGGPVTDGRRMITSHGNDLPSVVIRVPSQSLIDANLPRALCVASVNSGAVWRNSGHDARQLRSAVMPMMSFAGDARLIRECSFYGAARLPMDAKIATSTLWDWRELW